MVLGGSDLVGAHGETAKNGVVEDQVGAKLGFTNPAYFSIFWSITQNSRYMNNDRIIGSRT